MSLSFRFGSTFDKTAAPAASGLSSGNFGQRAAVHGLRAWRGLGTSGRNAALGALAGGVINKLRGGDFWRGAVVGGGAGYAGTKLGLTNTDFATKALAGIGADPLERKARGSTAKPTPPQAAPAPEQAPKQVSKPPVAEAASRAEEPVTINRDPEPAREEPRVSRSAGPKKSSYTAAEVKANKERMMASRAASEKAAKEKAMATTSRAVEAATPKTIPAAPDDEPAMWGTGSVLKPAVAEAARRRKPLPEDMSAYEGVSGFGKSAALRKIARLLGT